MDNSQPTPQTPTSESTLAATTQANNVLLQKQRAQEQQQWANYSPAQISQAMSKVAPNSTAGQIGKAVATPNYAYSGLCLKWVDDQQGNNTNRQPTAYADYLANSQAGNISTSSDIPTGARVYFSPDNSNGGAGHVGIYQGDGQFTSATDNGIQTFNINDWEKMTGQSMLGWSSSNT